jgi:hypothetical protein
MKGIYLIQNLLNGKIYKGLKYSEESRKKMSESAKKWRRNKIDSKLIS